MKRCFPLLGLLSLFLAGLACQLPAAQMPPTPTAVVAQAALTAAPSPTANVQPTATGSAAAAADATALPAPTLSAESAASTESVASAATASPQCTVLKDANFRKGPGTAYQPPLRALPAGTVLVPQGFNPKGTPSGSWVQVLDPAANQVGWVSDDPQLLQCNIDLTRLPQVAVSAPPPPPAPVVSNSQVEGQSNGLKGTVHFSQDYLMRMEVRASQGSKDGDGIKRVTFAISDASGAVYQRTESTAAYCVFGGGEPDCNRWTQENGKFVWKPGGQPVKAGTYHVSIEVEPSGANGDASQFGHWEFDITINLPY